MTRSGIYAIRNRSNGRIYVGSAVDLAQRWREHRHLLRRGGHHSIKLQRSWDKHGEGAFDFVELEAVPPDGLLPREQHWIDHFKAAHPVKGYNVACFAGSRRGVPHSPEARAKMSLAHRGKRRTEEHRLNLSLALKGKRKSPEHRAALSASKRGKPLGPQSPAHREKRLAAIRATRAARTLERRARCL